MDAVAPIRAPAGAAVPFALLAVAVWAGPAYGQSEALSEEDAARLEEVNEAQRDFEAFREDRTPVRPERENATCDEQIGRICIWFGGEGERDFPGELREVGQAREQLIRDLTDAHEWLAHPWVLGQLVHYLVEARQPNEAERVARRCGVDPEWWCHALRGYALHVRTAYVEAEAAFREALDLMPAEERDRWMDPTYVFTPGAVSEFRALGPVERELAFDLLWRLSDPLFLFEGNDRFTDHMARLVQARNYSDAGHPQGMGWDEDIEATLIRYGRIVGYSRSHDPRSTFGGGQLRDTRRMVGHHHPSSRGYLFPEEFLESPAEVPPESWITAPREARTWYAPPYAPDIRGLETQVGRFRRGDEMLVVGAYRPLVASDESDAQPESPFASEAPAGPIHAALFLVPEDGSPLNFVQGTEPEGVLTLYSWPGRYVSSLEVVDQQNGRAWRARQGVVQRPLTEGLVGVSDLLVLRDGAPLPETLDEAIPHVRPGVRIRQGERFGVVWEVYGLRVLEPVQVTLGFTEGRPGFLARVGDFLGILEPAQPVEVTFEDMGDDLIQSAFRSVQLELPDLDPGEYTLHLRLDLVGREPVVASRPITVVE